MEGNSFLDLQRRADVSLDLGVIFNGITGALQGIFDLAASSLMLWDDEKGSLHVAAVYNLSEEYLRLSSATRRKVTMSPSLMALHQRQPVYISNVYEHELFAPWKDLAQMEGYAAFISIPLTHQDRPIGVVNAYLQKPHVFDEDELHMVTLLASQAAISIENYRLHKEIQKSYLTTIKALVNAVEAKDHYTRGHSERVTKCSLLIARNMELSSRQMELISIAGALHDIGKITIDLSILHKPGKLTQEELDTVRRHPVVGYNIISPLEFLKDVRTCIQEHHEHFNGRGYPYGKAGNDIALESRILAVADAFDAMTTPRSYRQSLAVKDALKEIEHCAGTQFDPQVVLSLSRSLRGRVGSLVP